MTGTVMEAILLKNGRIIDPSSDIDLAGDLLIEDRRIADIGPGLKGPEHAQLVDLNNKWVVPGLIDMHVHLREPGQEYKETIETGTRAAAAGGFTKVACMPNTSPPNDNEGITRFILDKAREAGNCQVLPVAAVSTGQKGRGLTEFFDLLNAGAVAFSDDGVPVRKASVMRLALEYALNFDALIISHAEEPDLSAQGCMNEGITSTRLGLRGIPNAAEDVAVFRDCCLAELTGARLHIAHVSTKGAVEIIRRAKEKGVKVTAETAPHYFSLTEEAVEDYNTLAKMNPPLRTEEDRRAIIEGLRDGTIDAIATDHAPHESLSKECEFALAANGIIGLETALPLALKVLLREEGFSPLEIARLMSQNPASILKVEGGSLEKGKRADVTVIDSELPFTLDRDSLFSKSFNSPFLGQSFRGRAILTIMEGKVTFDLLGLLREG